MDVLTGCATQWGGSAAGFIKCNDNSSSRHIGLDVKYGVLGERTGGI